MDENQRIAARLRQAAERLELCDSFRAAAYRRAATSVEASPRSLRDVYDRYGPIAPEELHGVGAGIAAIAEMLITGRWKYVERLCDARERVISYVDDEGIEHACSVLETRPKRRLHGRDAIAALLRAK